MWLKFTIEDSQGKIESSKQDAGMQIFSCEGLRGKYFRLC